MFDSVPQHQTTNPDPNGSTSLSILLIITNEVGMTFLQLDLTRDESPVGPRLNKNAYRTPRRVQCEKEHGAHTANRCSF